VFNLIALIDIAIALTILEVVLIVALHRRSVRPSKLAPLIVNLGSGLALMFALRGAVHGWSEIVVVLCLAFAGYCHLADMRQRWRAARTS
jgi:hypothetical protein